MSRLRPPGRRDPLRFFAALRRPAPEPEGADGPTVASAVNDLLDHGYPPELMLKILREHLDSTFAATLAGSLNDGETALDVIGRILADKHLGIDLAHGLIIYSAAARALFEETADLGRHPDWLDDMTGFPGDFVYALWIPSTRFESDPFTHGPLRAALCDFIFARITDPHELLRGGDWTHSPSVQAEFRARAARLIG